MDKKGRKKNVKEGAIIAEKAIQALSKLHDDYELARAYRFAAFNNMSKLKEGAKICQNYVEKAFEYSKKTGDAWLISFSYGPAWSIAVGNFNPDLALEYSKEMMNVGTVAKDNFLIGLGASFSVTTLRILTSVIEDPDKEKENLLEIEKMAHEATIRGHIINYPPIFLLSYSSRGDALTKLASIETDPIRKQSHLKGP